jgi:putative transcriptional regulator
MSEGAAETDVGGLDVLRSKREATRYQILVEIAERQPAVSQQEIADAIGITAQAVSDYLQDLTAAGHVESGGRGRYEVTKEGVDWLISRTEDLQAYTRHVTEDIVGRVEVDTAIATADVKTGDTVGLAMREGVLHAVPGSSHEATAVAVTDAAAGTDVGVTDFEGILEYDPGEVTILTVPRVQDGGSRAVESDRVQTAAAAHDLLVVTGVEALAAIRAAERKPDVRFGGPAAAREAATKGLDVLLVTVAGRVAEHTDALRDGGLAYEVVDAASD